jgi:hypothetical protein
LDFFFPYQEVTPIPDFMFREVDHEETSKGGLDGSMTVAYKSEIVPGNKLAYLLTEGQLPVQNKERGIIVLPPDNARKGALVQVLAGFSLDGQRMIAEVPSLKVSQDEIAYASNLAESYKRDIVTLYFQSKQERSAGGFGQLLPTGMIKVYMEELGIEDLALPNMQKKETPKSASMSGWDPAERDAFLKDIAASVREQVRKEVMAEIQAKSAKNIV